MKGANLRGGTKKHHVRLLFLWGGIALLAVVAIGAAIVARSSGSEPSAISFQIASPASDTSVSSPVPLNVVLQGAKLGLPTDGLDHLHIAVDGGQTLAIYETPEPSLTLPPGQHTLIVEVAGPDHQALSAAQSVTFVVRP